GIEEGHVSGADRRLREQPRIARADARADERPEQQQRDGDGQNAPEHARILRRWGLTLSGPGKGPGDRAWVAALSGKGNRAQGGLCFAHPQALFPLPSAWPYPQAQFPMPFAWPYPQAPLLGPTGA